MAEVVAQNGEGPDERPAVGMELGKGLVDLGQQGTFEPSKRKTQFNSFKYGGVKEEERVLCVHGIVSTHEFTLPARHDLHESVVLLPEDTRLIFVAFAILVGLKVFKGGYFRSLGQKGFRGPMI